MRRRRQTVQIWNPARRWMKVSAGCESPSVLLTPAPISAPSQPAELSNWSSVASQRLNISSCYLFAADDIPSDAEAEARLHQSECVDPLPEEAKRSESLRMSSSIGTCLLSFALREQLSRSHGWLQPRDLGIFTGVPVQNKKKPIKLSRIVMVVSCRRLHRNEDSSRLIK